MRKTIFYLVVILFVASCGDNKSDDSSSPKTNVKDSLNISAVLEILPVSDSIFKPPYYIINLNASENIDSAIAVVKNLRGEFENVNYLWIPDYESLSGKELFSIFLGPFSNLQTCMPILMDYKETHPDSYAVFVSHEMERRVVYSPYDIRMDGQRVKQVFIYAEPKASEEYFEEGGEDWGWFVGDVLEYFSKNHPEVESFNVYNDILRDKDIKKLEKEMELDGSFGYLLINGKEKEFLNHDMSNSIISAACEFFNFEFIEID